MPTKHRSPADLGQAVVRELRRRKQAHPTPTILTELFHTLYFASLKTEESQPIQCYIVYLDPDNPDPKPPQRIVRDRWSCVAFSTRIPFTVSSLIKIAKASDPRTSSFAVYHDKTDGLYIWGLVDQGNRYHEFVNFDSESGPERPGLFQASIAGIGHLVAYRGYERIAELNVDTLVTESHDVLRFGPVRRLLQPGIDDFVSAVTTAMQLNSESEFWKPILEGDWIATLCRLILRIRNYRHGGAILITPDRTHAGLNIKYEVDYKRLRLALEHRATHQIEKYSAVDTIFEFMDDDKVHQIPLDLHLDESIASDELEDSNSELDASIWFVSLLSRVDGLVLLTPNLGVEGFGVEILQENSPSRIFRSGTATATTRSLRRADYQHFGTRHRSMMRYCYQVPGSVGFVISQDGDVRVMVRVGEDLIFWDSIRLQLDEFVRQRRRHARISAAHGARA